MKLKHYILFGAGLLLAASCTQAPESDQAETTQAQEVTEAASTHTVQVNTDASTIKWIGTKVTAHHVGTIGIKNGTVNIDNGMVTGGQLVFDMRSLQVIGPEGSDPGKNEKLKNHLMSPDFFGVDEHPEASFEITAVSAFEGTLEEEDADPRQEAISEYKLANPGHSISGNLTIKEVTKNITVPARVNVSDDGIVDVTTKFNIDRTNWGITYPGMPDDLIRDQVHLGISVSTMPAQTAQSL